MKKFLLSLFILFFILNINFVFANDIIITTTNDELDSATDCTDNPDDCSLREAIEAFNDSVSDDFAIILPADTITLSLEGDNENSNATGDLDISNGNDVTLTIEGDSAATSIIDGGSGGTCSGEDDYFDRLIEISSSTTVVLSSLTMQGGCFNASGAAINNSGDLTINDCIFKDNEADTPGADAGAIFNAADTLEINNSLFYDNQAGGNGGAILNNSSTTLNITNTTIYSNGAYKSGGGVYNSGTANIISSTIYANVANTPEDPNDGDGGGVYNGSTGTLNFKNTILANNLNEETAEDCYLGSGTFNSYGYNINSDTTCSLDGIGDLSATDPLLDASGLEDNGGQTNTVSLQTTSPAKDVIPAANCTNEIAESTSLTEDQRGFTRPENSNCDIGAYEIDQTDPTVTALTGTDTIECSVDSWTDSGATVNDNFYTGLSYSTSGSVDESLVSSYVITYTSGADYDGNTGQNTRTVTVQDTTAPVITITNNTEDYNTLECGLDSWTDPGATASDACDSAVTASTSNTVDTSVVDNYIITYTATDDENNPATSSRTVTVEDTTDPVITIIGESEISINQNETYEDAGASVSDVCDTDITISTDNPVDTSIAGIYTVTYTATDNENNSVSATRTVTVLAVAEEPESPDEGEEDEELEEDYTPTKVKNVTVPKKTKKKKKAKIKWTKQEDATGYIIQLQKYNKKTKKYKKIRTIKLNTNKRYKLVKKLKANTKYRIKVRAKRLVDGTTYKGTWSKYKKFKTKK